MKKLFGGVVLASSVAIALGACASNQKQAPTAEEVRDGEALPPAPPVPAEPASTDSPTAPTVPGGSSGAMTPEGPTGATPPPEPPPAKEVLSESQMLRVSELVNTAELEQAKLAQQRAKSADVRKFADMMVRHHSDALKEQARIAKKLKLSAADSVAAAQLKTDSEKTLEQLKKTDAASFDAAYVQSQVAGHQQALDLLDAQLLPAAKTPEVTDALRYARSAVAQHLEQARALQTPERSGPTANNQ